MTIKVAAQPQGQALAVHRCRFVDHNPSPISAIAFPPLALPSSESVNRIPGSSNAKRKFGTLAVGRANGNIELCEWSGAIYENQAPKAWVLSKILYGPNPSKIDTLVFTLKFPYLHSANEVPALSDLRLFSAGGGSELVEWDLVHGTILRTINSQGGAIWSMAANFSSTLLALGCEDGRVRLLSLEGNALIHHRRFDRVKSRLLSVAWGPPVPVTQMKQKKESSRQENSTSDVESDSGADSDDDDEWTDSWLVTGGSDSCIRKWDVNSGRPIERMTMDKMRGERTLVWAVGVLADGTIVSGDSLGIVKFWDAKTCTQLHSFQSHGADVLCLAISPDGTSIFTSGVDQKVCLFTRVVVSNGDKVGQKEAHVSSRWVHSTAKRMHSHDVRALAIWPPYVPVSPFTLRSSSSSRSFTPNPFTGISPILASGGLDASLVLVPCASPHGHHNIVNPLSTSAVVTFEDAYYRRVAYPTGLVPSVRVAHTARLVICAQDTRVTVWRICGKARVRSALEMDLLTADAAEVDDARMDIDGVEDGTVPSKKEEEECGYERALDMQLDMTTNICASAISDDGQWLAVADMYETKLFELSSTLESGAQKTEYTALRPRRVKNFMSILTPHFPKVDVETVGSEGSSALGFSPDGSKLVLACALSARVLVVDLSERDKMGRPAPRVLRSFEQHRIGIERVVRSMPGRSNATTRVGNSNEDMDVDIGGEQKRKEAELNGGADTKEMPSDDEDEETDELHALVTRLAFSPDGQWFATTDNYNRTHIFNLDAVQYHTTLPTSTSLVVAIAFSPTYHSPSSSTHAQSQAALILLMAHADSSLTIYDVERRRFPEWAAHLSQRENLPRRWIGLHDSVLGIAFDPPPPTGSAQTASPIATSTVKKSEKNGKKKKKRTAEAHASVNANEETSAGQRHVTLWGATWLCRITLDAPVGWGGFIKKRRRDGSPSRVSDSQIHRHDEEEVTNFKLVTRYRPLLCVDYLDAGELLVVERPLVDVLRELPPAFFKPKYGS